MEEALHGDDAATLRQSISRKCSEVVSGFPLISFAQTSEIVEHLLPPKPMFPSSLASTSPIQAGTSSIPDFANDPDFAPYAEQMQAIADGKVGKDGKVVLSDHASLLDSATAALSSAVRDCGTDLANIRWVNVPYRLSDAVLNAATHIPVRPRKLRKRDKAAGTIAAHALNSVNFPYPSPAPSLLPGEVFLPDILPLPPATNDLLERTQALLPANVRKALETAPPPDWLIKPHPKSAENAKKHNYARSVFYSCLDQEIASDSNLTSQFQPLERVKPELTLPSTPICSSTATVLAHAAAAVSTSPSEASTAVRPLSASRHAQSIIDSAMSLVSTSPDPMRLLSPGRSAVVVEVPAKRRATDAGVIFTSVKKARTIPDMRDLPKGKKPNVFSEPTSDVDAAIYESDRHVKADSEESVVILATTSSPSIQPIRKPARVGSASPPKRRHLESVQGAEHARLEHLVALMDDIFAADDILSTAKYHGETINAFDLQEIYENCDGIWVMRSDMVVRLGKCITNLVATVGGKQLFENAFGKAQALQHHDDAQGIDKVSVESIRRLTQILGRNLKHASKAITLEFYETASIRSAPIPTKATKAKKAKCTVAKIATDDCQTAKRLSMTPKRSSQSRSPSLRRSSSQAASGDEFESELEEDLIGAIEGEYSDESTPNHTIKRKAKSKLERGVSDATQAHSAATEITTMHLDTLNSNLKHLTKVMQIIATVLTTLSVARLPKQAYSEDLLISCLDHIKRNMLGPIYASLHTSDKQFGTVFRANAAPDYVRLCLHLNGELLSLLAKLLHNNVMSDTIVIHTVYISIAPFFIDSGMNNKARGKQPFDAVLKLLTVEALELTTIIFAKYTSQRHWITEEILSSITKLPNLAKRKPNYLLADGQAVHINSVLLLHLVQSTTSGTQRLLAWQARRRAEGNGDDISLDDISSVYSAAGRCCSAIAGFLTQRSSKAPKNASANEAEYKAVLEHLVRDSLILLDFAQWPAATLMVQTLVRILVTLFDDVKTNADANSAKAMALDHLGAIAYKLYGIANVNRLPSPDDALRLQPLNLIIRRQSCTELRSLAEQETKFITLMQKMCRHEMAAEIAVEFVSSRWCHDLHQHLRSLDEVEHLQVKHAEFESDVIHCIDQCVQLASTTAAANTNDNPQQLLSDFDHSLRTLWPARGIQSMKELLLRAILASCDGSVIAFRQKALKALAVVIERDPSLFTKPEIETTLEQRMLDQSPAVRDAALELLSRYIACDARLASQYLPRILLRVADAGLSVRKRVIKTLRSMYPIVMSSAERIDICKRLVGRIHDEDEGVKDLAAVALEEFLFPPSNAGGNAASAAYDVQDRARILISVAAALHERPSPLELVIEKIMQSHYDKDGSAKKSMEEFVNALSALLETLVDMLVDKAKDRQIDIVHCIKALHILVVSNPALLTVTQAAHLLPYLRSITSPDEQTIAEFVLRSFKAVIPSLPIGPASRLSRDIQNATRTLLNKPASIGDKALPELVACYCAVIIHQTQDYGKLCSVFQACYNRLRAGIAKFANAGSRLSTSDRDQLFRNLPVLAKLVCLFCQFGDFDRLRQNSPDARVHIDTISNESIQATVFGEMIQVYQLTAGSASHGTALQCLGFLYRASPMLMLQGSSTRIMDCILANGTAEAKVQLLRVIVEFLQSQSGSSSKRSDDTGDGDATDMQLLVGLADTFAESGVSSAVIQRYLPNIIDAALSSTLQNSLTGLALEAISFTVKQGLAHPMQCLPALVALECSGSELVAKRAFALHSSLHSKHSALINTRIAESITSAFLYQRRTLAHMSGCYGEPPRARLAHWYSLMREKRAWRLDFLKAFLRGLSFELADGKYTFETVEFARYTAENLAAFEYRSQEEVFFVIATCTAGLVTNGMQIVGRATKKVFMRLTAEAFLYQYHRAQAVFVPEQPDLNASTVLPATEARQSITTSFIFCLRGHLRQMYGVTDQKMAKYTTNKRSTAGDKPAVARDGTLGQLDYSRIPFAYKDMINNEECKHQLRQFIELIDSDDSISAVQADAGRESD